MADNRIRPAVLASGQVALSQNKRFWKIIDDAIERGKKEGYVDLADL